MADEPKPMFVERDEFNDVVAFHYLCPKCKQYTIIRTYNKQTLSGEITYMCWSDICRSNTTLRIIRDRAVIVSNMPKPDVVKKLPENRASPKVWTDISAGSFKLPRNSQN